MQDKTLQHPDGSVCVDFSHLLTVDKEGIELAKGASLYGVLTPKTLGNTWYLDFYIEAKGVEAKLCVPLKDHILYPRPVFRWPGDGLSLAQRIEHRVQQLTLSAYEFDYNPGFPYYELDLYVAVTGRFSTWYRLWQEPYYENSSLEKNLFRFINFREDGEHAGAKEVLLERYNKRKPERRSARRRRRESEVKIV